MARKGKRGNRGGGKGETQTDVTQSQFVPRANYGATHVAGASQTLRRTLVWSSWSSQSVPSGTMFDLLSINVNNAYAPNPSLFSSSATGYNRYMQFYGKCFVRGARLRVDFTSMPAVVTTVGLTPFPMAVGISIQSNDDPLSTLGDAIDSGLVRWKTISSSPSTCSISVGLDIQKYLGVSNLMDVDTAYSTVGASPGAASKVFAHLWACNQGETSGVVYSVELELDVLFIDPIPFT